MIERSTVIEAPLDAVYALVRDFKRWPEWSPWLSAEKEATLSFGEEGRSYAWNGKIVGSGEMRLLDAVENQSLQMQLDLLTPWRSQSQVRFEFESLLSLFIVNCLRSKPMRCNTRGRIVTWAMPGRQACYAAARKCLSRVRKSFPSKCM
ncbi:SRPBCC family protein [Thalassobacterium maritimum]|nr:SRPBCC family protein [Coraliomargarita sp. SDUM461003]